jgi:hypothetical protein
MKDESGEWEITTENEAITISADCGQMGWMLRHDQEKMLAEYLHQKYFQNNEYWFDMYEEYKAKHDISVDKYFKLSIKYSELADKYADLVDKFLNAPVPKSVYMPDFFKDEDDL